MGWLVDDVVQDPLGQFGLPLFNDEIVALSLKFGFRALPFHIHEVIISFLFYNTVFYGSSLLSPLVIRDYRTLSPRTQINFDIHVVSQVQAILIVILSVPLLGDTTLAKDHINGYTPYAGFVAAMAMGYFVWDSYICLRYVKLFGVGFLVHGLASLFVFVQGMRPYLMYYSPIFLMFELSTPFINNHWFASHLPQGVVPELFQLINGGLLVLVFFFARIPWGFAQAGRVAWDLWPALWGTPTSTGIPGETHPVWLPFGVLACNLSLDFLNVVWFRKIATLLQRRLASNKRKTDDEAKTKSD